MHRCCYLTLFVACLACAGCHDGPLYALKHANPILVQQWRADEALGTTDHQRRKELELLVRTMPTLSAADRAGWQPHLRKLMENDPNADMRHLAIRASQSIEGPAALELIEMGLDDENLKVRMAACDVLGKRPEPAAAQRLARLAGESTNLDVRQAALRGLQNQGGDVANNAMKLALEDRDPAIRMTAVASLEKMTGKDFGNQPEAWLAFLNGQAPEPEPESAGSGISLPDLF